MNPLSTSPLFGFALTLLLLYGVKKFFPRWQLLDFPERYNVRRPPLPYPGGIAAVLAFILIFPLMVAINQKSIAVFSAVFILGITSFIDDRKNLSALKRLAVQCFCAFLVFAAGDCTSGRICSLTNPFEFFTGNAILELNSTFPLVSAILTISWLIMTTNALNWFDGIPGQVTVLSTLGFTVIGLLALSERVNQPELAALSFTLAGIAFACSLFDLPPPKMVLGDTGSMFFGFMLGVLTIFAGGKVATAFLVLGVPLVDFLFVIIKRIKDGRSPWKGSMQGEHLHHRLRAKGWSDKRIITLTAGIGLLFGMTALFLNTLEKVGAAALLCILMLTLWEYSKPSSRSAL